MAFLMTDMAAGSTAVRQMQQNAYGAKYDEQNTQALAQQEQLKVQQEQANVEKTRIANLVANAGYQHDEDSTSKIQSWLKTPEGQGANDTKKLQKMAQFKFESGLTEQGAALSKEAMAIEAKDIADKQKSLDLHAQEIGNAYGVVAALKTPEEINSFFDEMKNNKPKEYKQMTDMIGPSTFDKMTPQEKQEALKNLTLNAKGQIGSQMKAVEIEKALIRERESRYRADAIERAAMYRRDTPPAGREDPRDKAWGKFQTVTNNIEKLSEKQAEKLEEDVKNAQLVIDKNRIYDSSSETKTLQAAIKARDDFQRKRLTRLRDVALSSPDFDGKQDYVESYNRELAAIPKEDKPKAAEASPKPASAALVGKDGKQIGGTSNKLQLAPQDKEALDWANKNPNDPRAAKIKQRLGM